MLVIQGGIFKMRIKLDTLNDFEKLSTEVAGQISGGKKHKKLNKVGYVIGYAYGVVERVIVGSSKDLNRW